VCIVKKSVVTLWTQTSKVKNIAHAPLLKQLEGFPASDFIKRWLKAGYFKDSVFYETEIGTLQDGIVSPLLATIALHGMEQVLNIQYRVGGYVKLHIFTF
jgi:retron-type reverse transcriptase